MPRRKGKQTNFQYAEAPVFQYQTFDRATQESLAYHQNPIFPDQPILFSNRFANSVPQSEQALAHDELEPAPSEEQPADEGRPLQSVFVTIR